MRLLTELTEQYDLTRAQVAFAASAVRRHSEPENLYTSEAVGEQLRELKKRWAGYHLREYALGFDDEERVVQEQVTELLSESGCDTLLDDVRAMMHAARDVATHYSKRKEHAYR